MFPSHATKLSLANQFYPWNFFNRMRTFLKYREQIIVPTSNMALNSGPMYPYLEAFIWNHFLRPSIGRSEADCAIDCPRRVQPRDWSQIESVPSFKMPPKLKSSKPNRSISCFINPHQLFHHLSSDSLTVKITSIIAWAWVTSDDLRTNLLTLWTCCIKLFPKHITGNILISIEPLFLIRVLWTAHLSRTRPSSVGSWIPVPYIYPKLLLRQSFPRGISTMFHS